MRKCQFVLEPNIVSVKVHSEIINNLPMVKHHQFYKTFILPYIDMVEWKHDWARDYKKDGRYIND